MGSLIAFMVARGVGERWARPLAYVLLAIAIVALIGAAKCGYDRSIIRDHDARQDAVTAKADRKADAVAAETRRVDDARIAQEITQLEKVQYHAPTAVDRRLARHRCLRLQQAARRERREPPACS